MKFLITIAMLLSANAIADYKLATNGKTVKCYADDNQEWILNKSRRTVKYTVEGESLGPKRIHTTNSDEKTFISYSTETGTLTLGEKDTYQFAEEDEVAVIDCN